MPKLRTTNAAQEAERLQATYGIDESAARALVAYLDTGSELAAAERLGVPAEEVTRLLSENDLVRKAITEEIKNRIAVGAAIGWKVLTELAQGGPAAVRLAAAKALVDRQFGKEAQHVEVHVHRGLTEDRLLGRISELMEKLGIDKPPTIIDVTPVEVVEPPRKSIPKVQQLLKQKTIDMAAINGPEPWEIVAAKGI